VPASPWERTDQSTRRDMDGSPVARDCHPLGGYACAVMGGRRLTEGEVGGNRSLRIIDWTGS
jgi:hypothetical protein